MIIIYGKPGSINTARAIDYCKNNSLQYSYKVLGQDITKEVLEHMSGLTLNAAPYIFTKNGGLFEYVGGFSALEKRFK